MNIKIFSNKLKGQVDIPSSKSITHRALICASLARGTSIIENPLYCDDTLTTIDILENLGLDLRQEQNRIIINSSGEYQILGSLNANDSASSLRFLLVLISIFIPSFTFKASHRLIERIRTQDLDVFSDLTFNFSKEEIHIEGPLKVINNDISFKLTSQWASGLLMGLPMASYRLKSDILKEDYVKLSLNIMNKFSVNVNETKGWLITNDTYKASKVLVEVDYSSLAFFLVMSIFNPDLEVGKVGKESKQADFRIISLLSQMGVSFKNINSYLSLDSLDFKECELDLTYSPDLAPVLAALAAVSSKKISLTGLTRLAYKESNRLEAMFKNLSLLGANIKTYEDKMIIEGQDFLEGEVLLDSYNDHRIVMSLVAISSRIKKPFIINNANVVRKSFPSFFDIFKSIGGSYESNI